MVLPMPPKRRLLSGVLVALPALAAAEPLTLEAALARAGATGEEIAAAQAGLDEAEQGVRVARSAFFPTLTGTIGYVRTLASQFDLEIPMDPDAMIDFGELPFGQPNQWSLTLQSAWNVYRGGADAARLRAARARAGSARLELDAARAQLLLDVTAAYHDAQLAEALVGIAEAALAQAEATLAQVELGAREGTRAEFELVRARVARDNARPAAIRARVDRDLARARLRSLVNLAPDA
jgi:outer membrane protein TolC